MIWSKTVLEQVGYLLIVGRIRDSSTVDLSRPFFFLLYRSILITMTELNGRIYRVCVQFLDVFLPAGAESRKNS